MLLKVDILDYCNSLFSSIFKNDSAVKIVQVESYQVPVDTLVSLVPVFKKLHWLPVEHCLVYKFLHKNFAPCTSFDV